MSEAVGKLSADDQAFIALRWGVEPVKLVDMAKRLGISVTGVHQRQERILKTLRGMLT